MVPVPVTHILDKASSNVFVKIVRIGGVVGIGFRKLEIHRRLLAIQIRI